MAVTALVGSRERYYKVHALETDMVVPRVVRYLVC